MSADKVMSRVQDAVRPRWRPRRVAVAVVAVALVAGAVGWGAAQVLDPDPVASVADDYTLVTVESGQVGQSLSLNAVARWQTQVSGTNRASGTVTDVSVEPGQSVNAGAVLYRVDERPVVVAEGEVPAFRELARDAEGDDVRQLQEMLAALGYLESDPDGEFGAGTERAVEEWQESLGVPEDGRVRLGDVMFAAVDLPARLTIDGEIVHRDALLAGGEPVLSALPPDPEFTVPVTPTQSAMITDGTTAAITSPQGQTWRAEVAGRTSRDDGDGMVLALSGPDGGPVAGQEADQVPVEGETILGAQIEIVPTTQGLVVPAAALRAEGDGSTVVIDKAGTVVPVEVDVSASGLAIVNGVDEGVQLRAPAWSPEDDT